MGSIRSNSGTSSERSPGVIFGTGISCSYGGSSYGGSSGSTAAVATAVAVAPIVVVVVGLGIYSIVFDSTPSWSFNTPTIIYTRGTLGIGRVRSTKVGFQLAIPPRPRVLYFAFFIFEGSHYLIIPEFFIFGFGELYIVSEFFLFSDRELYVM